MSWVWVPGNAWTGKNVYLEWKLHQTSHRTSYKVKIKWVNKWDSLFNQSNNQFRSVFSICYFSFITLLWSTFNLKLVRQQVCDWIAIFKGLKSSNETYVTNMANWTNKTWGNTTKQEKELTVSFQIWCMGGQNQIAVVSRIT